MPEASALPTCFLHPSSEVDQETVHYWLGGHLVATRDGGGLKFTHTDHLGSSSVATDVSGNAVAGSTYYPYGEHRSSTGAFGTDRDYTGQYLATGTGLHFYNARYYESALGRFISPDSVVPDGREPSDFNRYTYVKNNPLRYTDPTGHCYGPFSAFRKNVGGGLICRSVDDVVEAVEHVPETATAAAAFVAQPAASAIQPDSGTSCLCVDATGGFMWGASVSVGVVVDSNGDYGISGNAGAGGYGGAGIGLSVQMQQTNAETIDETRGTSLEAGFTGSIFGLGVSSEVIGGGEVGDGYVGASAGVGVNLGTPAGYGIIESTGIWGLGTLFPQGSSSNRSSQATQVTSVRRVDYVPIISTVTVGGRTIKIREA